MRRHAKRGKRRRHKKKTGQHQTECATKGLKEEGEKEEEKGRWEGAMWCQLNMQQSGRRDRALPGKLCKGVQEKKNLATFAIYRTHKEMFSPLDFTVGTGTCTQVA